MHVKGDKEYRELKGNYWINNNWNAEIPKSALEKKEWEWGKIAHTVKLIVCLVDGIWWRLMKWNPSFPPPTY